MSTPPNINPVLKMRLGKSMLKDYITYVSRSPNKTPNQLVDVVYFGYKRWFDSMSQDDLDDFTGLFEKASLSMDIDVHWDVTVKKQQQASNVFNSFLKRMKPYGQEGKQDAALVTKTLNEEFGKEYKIGTKSINIIKAFSGDPQLKMVAKRMVRELAKLGYKF